jgi:2'-5' RNA ligase
MESKHHGSDYKYGCVMIYLDIPNWNEIISFINPEDIYRPEDTSKGLETDPHVTVLYGLHSTVSNSDVQSIVDQIDGNKINLKIRGVGVFENKDFDVVKFNVESGYLHQMNYMFRSLPYSSDYPDYKPHITIAYVKPGTGKKYEDSSYKYKLPEVHKIVYSKPNDDKIEFTM